MPENLPPPNFNLWREPWIEVAYPDGVLQTLSLAQVLTEAHEIHALYEPSPLVSLAIHRLLTAVLQHIYNPPRPSALPAIWREGQFSADKITDFGARFAERFDLFSEETPFLQTADLPLQPAKGDNAKPVAYLFQEQTAGTAVTHYNHVYDESQILCASCAAKGLLLIPPFASSGGKGIKPSINGVPPIYVLPGGETLFQSLAASLVSQPYQPVPSQNERDEAWWERAPVIIGKSEEIRRVGYLYSLLFPARRVRLHPVNLHQPCSRCGQQTTWGVRTMIFEMGESRPKNSAFWRDPFAAYRPQKEGNDAPLPIRPVEGRALWREFAGLFLPDKSEASQAIRPAILDQLEAIFAQGGPQLYPNGRVPVRTVGLRTDMKMKIFEWEESGFILTPHLLQDDNTAAQIKTVVEIAQECDRILKGSFSTYFGGGKSEKYTPLRLQMSQQYWQRLGEAFHQHLTQYTPTADLRRLQDEWVATVLGVAIDIFQETADNLPNDGPTLMKRQHAINHNRAKLYSFRNKKYPKLQEENE